MVEYWKQVAEFENYEVSSVGRVRRDGRCLKPYPNSKGYLRVSLRKNGQTYIRFVHRLVAQHFIPNPLMKPQVNHKDGNRQNNHVDNLEWVTNSENQLHGRRTGLITSLKGEEHQDAKLTEDDVRWIRDNCGKGRGFGYKALANKFGVSHTTIRNIVIGNKWRHVK